MTFAVARETSWPTGDAFVADEADEHPETHPYTDASTPIWAATPTAATTSSTWPSASTIDGLWRVDATEDERMADFM